MLKVKNYLMPILAIALFLSFQTNAQDRVYTQETVWNVTFVRTTEAYFDDYLSNLDNGWRKVMDEAKKDGTVLSYKVLSSVPVSPDDWDLMLMVEYKNMAVFDSLRDKMEEIQKKNFGSKKTIQESAVKRGDLRDILGTKVTRELKFK